MNEGTNDDLLLKEDLPTEIRTWVERTIGSGEQVKLTVSTDIKLDGMYGADWLIATDQRLLAFSPDGGGPPQTHEISLVDVRSVEIRNLFSNNILKIRTEDQGVDIARFSKTLMHKFTQVRPEIEKLVKEVRRAEFEEAEEEYGEEEHDHHRLRCPQCGRVIPHWSGICPSCVKKRKVFYRLLQYALPYWKVMTAGLSLMLIATFISLTPPLLNRTLIDDVLVRAWQTSQDITPSAQEEAARSANWIGESLQRFAAPGTIRLLAILVGLLLVISVLNNGLRALRSYLMAWIGQRVTYNLRNQVYEHLHMLSIGYFSRQETGRLMSRITNDAGRLQDFISDGLQEMVRSIFTLVIITGILFSMNWKLALYVLIPTPFMVIITLFFSEKLHKIYHVLWKRWAGMSAVLADTIPGVRVVKAFAQEEREVSKFSIRARELLDWAMKAAKLRTGFMPIMHFVTYMGTVIIWWVGGRQVMGGAITLGTFTAFTSYMWQFYWPVESLCRLNHRLQHAATAAERVFEVLDTEPDIGNEPDAIVLPEIKGRVEFRNATFAYEEGKPVLRDIDFTVEPGEMIGLAGHSGAGKSTLINLICRFYEVNEGAILIDGQDVRDVTLESLRSQIGVVLQEPFLFSGTVLENLAYGKPDASMEQIIASAKAANAHDFIMDYPDAYDTEVGERGTRVSGGERQRLAIARAILKDPRILILDEATSSVDTETESQIQEALERLIQGRTTFAIAHRLSTLRHSNRLLILEKGKLAEIGTHDELIEQDGIYAKLCRMQTDMSRIRAW